MDLLEWYPEIISTVLRNLVKVSNQGVGGKLTDFFLTDDCRFVWMTVGWQGKSRVCGVVVCVWLRDGKVWIEADMTEDGVAEMLIEAGIAREDVILGFDCEEGRPLGDRLIA